MLDKYDCLFVSGVGPANMVHFIALLIYFNSTRNM